MTENLTVQDDWVSAACTLPTVEQPLRRAEFDDLFANDVLSVTRTSEHVTRFDLRAGSGGCPEFRGTSVAVR